MNISAELGTGMKVPRSGTKYFFCNAKKMDDQKIRSILREAFHGCAIRVVLFGSRARGENVPTSDYDIGILPEEEIPAGCFSRARERLEESTIPQNIDLVDLSRTDREFRENVQREGIVWTL